MSEDQDDLCYYCQNPDLYGLLPVAEVDVPKWTNMTGARNDEGGIKRMHPPKYPVADFQGVECQLQVANRDGKWIKQQ